MLRSRNLSLCLFKKPQMARVTTLGCIFVYFSQNVLLAQDSPCRGYLGHQGFFKKQTRKQMKK